ETGTDAASADRAAPRRFRLPGDALCLIFLCLFTGALFAASVEARRPWFGLTGRPPLGFFDTLPSTAACWANNWFREGPWHTGFAVHVYPDSPEFASPAERRENAGYPGGFLLPLYLRALVLNAEVAPRHAAGYSLCCQFLTALFLSLAVFLALRAAGLGRAASLLFACVPAQLFLLLPLPFFNFLSVYWVEHAVLAPYALLLLLEMARIRGGRRGGVRPLQLLVLVWGLVTEWMFVPLVLVLFGVRLLSPEPVTRARVRREAWWVLAPAAIFLAAFLLRALWAGILWYPLVKLLEYSGVSEGPGPPWSVLTGVLSDWYGAGAMRAFWGALLAAAVPCLAYAAARLRRRPVSEGAYAVFVFLALLTLPMLAHFSVLRVHAMEHPHPSVKFAVILAALPLALLPGLAARFVFRRGAAAVGVTVIAAVMNVAAAGWAASGLIPGAERFRGDASRAPALVGECLGRWVGRGEVVFVENATLAFTLEMAGYSMKTAHPCASLYDMAERVRDCRGEFSVALLRVPPELRRDLSPLFLGEPWPPGEDGFGLDLFVREAEVLTDRATGIRLHRMPSPAFRDLCARLDVAPWRERQGRGNALADPDFGSLGGAGAWRVFPEGVEAGVAVGAPRPSPDCRAVRLSAAEILFGLSQRVDGLPAGGCHRALGYAALADGSVPCNFRLEVRSVEDGALLARSSPHVLASTLPDHGQWLACDFRVPPSGGPVEFSFVVSTPPSPVFHRAVTGCCFELFPVAETATAF
ncbi:MAG TPA: hypothetical protein PKV69_05415, partial [Candidatus Hydrogenedentes bacterium]|nr:hypothetical protein [Candidatus Hydrogenedentota bacterium]